MIGEGPVCITIDIDGLDPTGITCINAANLLFELTCLAAVAIDAKRSVG
ncbi:MAG: hypothetical protein JJU15_04400 [Pararhodobacter sp.]|nr:hypothetical protein [Pararhodobacter sp.]